MPARRASATQAVRQPRPPKPPSAAERNKQATQGIVSALAATDEKAVITAVLEAVNERLTGDTALRQRIGEKYTELAALTTRKQKPDLGPTPVPISGDGRTYSPSAKFDPYRLVEDYGRHQLRAVLMRATQKRLQEATGIVQDRTSVKPASRVAKQDMIDYIMAHVAPGY